MLPTHHPNHLKIKSGVSIVKDLLNCSVSSLHGDWVNMLSPWPKELLQYGTSLYIVAPFLTMKVVHATEF